MSVLDYFCLEAVSKAVLFHLQIVSGLKIQPEPLACAKEPGQPQGGIRGDIPLPVNNLVDASRRDADTLGQPVLADFHRAQELFQEDLAGVNGRRLFRHFVLS
jgi:hypothetical protein